MFHCHLDQAFIAHKARAQDFASRRYAVSVRGERSAFAVEIKLQVLGADDDVHWCTVRVARCQKPAEGRVDIRTLYLSLIHI